MNHERRPDGPLPKGIEPEVESLLSGVEAALVDLENEIRSYGCRIEQLQVLAAARAALTRASRLLLAQHARNSVERAVRSQDAAGARSAAAEIVQLIHRFGG